jgi:toxin-antitoxin system PIN domain toxin
VILPDVNLLIYAYRSDDPNHQQARAFLRSVIEDDSNFGISTLALSGFVRIVTNPRIHRQPTSLDDAFAFCNNILSQSHCEVVEPGSRHWAIFQRLCVQTNTRGGHSTDAWFAALAIEWGCEWVTFDRDFARFPGLKHTILPSSPA